MVSRFLAEIKPFADGEETVPMKRHFGELTLNIISKVCYITLIHCHKEKIFSGKINIIVDMPMLEILLPPIFQVHAIACTKCIYSISVRCTVYISHQV